jgi:glycerophosphoryl diester phosphodiesterase
VVFVATVLVDAAHGRGLLVHPNTVNGGREMSRLLDVVVDGMITDHPDRLDALVRSRAHLSR